MVSVDQPITISSKRFRRALECLATTFQYAGVRRADDWQFALDLAELKANGATLTDLRWMIRRRVAEPGRETTIRGDAERSFRKLAATSFPAETGFALSPAGASELKLTLHLGRTEVTHEIEPSPSDDAKARSPVGRRVIHEWDPVRRELCYGGQLINRFRVPAKNHTVVLAAFQEMSWPEFMDDPLPPSADQDSSERLQATIKVLNRSRVVHAISFHGNANGQQV